MADENIFTEFAFYLFPLALAILSLINGEMLFFFSAIAVLFSSFLFDLKIVNWLALGLAIAGLIMSIYQKYPTSIATNLVFLVFIFFRLILSGRKSVSGVIVRRSSVKRKVKFSLPSIDLPKWVVSPSLFVIAVGIWYLASEIIRSTIPSTILFVIAEGLVIYSIYYFFRRS